MGKFRLWPNGKHLPRKVFWHHFRQALAAMREDFSVEDEDDVWEERSTCTAIYRNVRFRIIAFADSSLIAPEDMVAYLNRMAKKGLCLQKIKLGEGRSEVWFWEEGDKETVYKVEISRILPNEEDWD